MSNKFLLKCKYQLFISEFLKTNGNGTIYSSKIEFLINFFYSLSMKYKQHKEEYINTIYRIIYRANIDYSFLLYKVYPKKIILHALTTNKKINYKFIKNYLDSMKYDFCPKIVCEILKRYHIDYIPTNLYHNDTLITVLYYYKYYGDELLDKKICYLGDYYKIKIKEMINNVRNILLIKKKLNICTDILKELKNYL